MRQRVPGTLDTVDKVKVAVALTMIHHERTDSRCIGPERQHDHVQHRSHVLFVVVRQSWFGPHQGAFQTGGRIGALLLLLSKLDTSLNGPHRLQVFVDRFLVSVADAAAQPP